MNRTHPAKITGILIILLIVSLNIPYTLLIQTFEYDDILRQPVNAVLTKFHAGGASLILTWFVFGLSALLFIPASILLHQLLARDNARYLSIATVAGILSGILQSIGLMRWVFVVPVLANLYTDPVSSPATREAVVVVFQAVHQYGGVVLGEYLGQTLMIIWTLGVSIAMVKSAMFRSWIPWFGLMTLPLLLLGQTELLKTVLPAIPVLELTPIGFMLWELWLLIVGISLLRSPLGKSPKKQRQVNRTLPILL